MSVLGGNISVPWGPEAKVAELGGGSAPLFHPNIDVRQVPGVDIVQSLTAPLTGLPPLDGIFSKFALEHVSWREVPTVISNIFQALKPGGSVLLVLPNTKAQMEWALRQPIVDDKVAQCLFGDQDYPENSHKAAFSTEYAFQLMEAAGFDAIVVQPYGEIKTDMIVEARKPFVKLTTGPVIHRPVDPMTGVATLTLRDQGHGAADWTPEERKLAYNRFYFDGGRGPVGGYSREGYWDYPVHYLTVKKILDLKPESVLELGCARGYVLKRLEDAGIRAAGLEVSHHCYLTRVTDAVREWDITQTPWPFFDKSVDLCYSVAVLEHIPESAMDRIAAEIQRVSKRGLHGVDFGEHDDGFDKTHCLFRNPSWWMSKLNSVPGSTQDVVDKELLEQGPIHPPHDAGGLLKINCGSWKTMFHHGWINLDVGDLGAWAKEYFYEFMRADLRNPLPFLSNTVSLIYASHFLEHLTYDEGLAFLKEAKRVLRHDGLVRIAVPDAPSLMMNFHSKLMGRFEEISDGVASQPHQAGKLYELLLSGHKAIYDWDSLSSTLLRAGFSDVKRSGFRESASAEMKRETVDMFPELSLYVEAK